MSDIRPTDTKHINEKQNSHCHRFCGEFLNQIKQLDMYTSKIVRIEFNDSHASIIAAVIVPIMIRVD